MSKLYPRLLPDEARRRFHMMLTSSLVALEAEASEKSERSYYAASGGVRVRPEELAHLRQRLEEVARENGYPERPKTVQLNEFDRGVARILHSSCDMAPGEAAQRPVWAFLAMVLVPHLCVWRFPRPNQDDVRSGNTKGVADRYRGDNPTRHVLGRLWWRAHLLHEPTRNDPYLLLSVLGEAAFDQIFARRTVAANARLVRSVVRAEASDVTRDVSTGAVTVDVLKRLLRVLAFVDIDWLYDDELDEMVREQRRIAVESLRESKRKGSGQTVFDDLAQPRLDSVTVEADWVGSPGAVDLSAVLVDRRRRVASDSDFIFYNQTVSHGGFVKLLEAETRASGRASRKLEIKLSALARDVASVIIVLSADSGTLGGVSLQLQVTGEGLEEPIERRFDEGIGAPAAGVLEFRRQRDGWSLEEVRDGFPEGLAGAARSLGVGVE